MSASDEDHVWEDVLEPTPSPTESTLTTSSRRRRRLPHKTQYVARRPLPLPPPLQPPKPPRPSVIQSDDVHDVAAFTYRYAIDVLSTAVALLRKPLSILVFLYLLALITARISQTLRSAFAPLCYLPGLSSSSLCLPDPIQEAHPTRWADYPKLVDVQSSTFEQLLDESVGGSGLSLEIKKAEMATTDLVTLVRVSDLRSRDMLADSLTDFVDDAKKTGRGLQKLSSKIGGAVDSIMAVNDYALHSIEAAHANAPSPYSLTFLLPWSRTVRPTNEIVTQTFNEAMNVLSASMQRLVLEAELNLANLDALEERLSTLHALVAREDSSLATLKTELLSELWTKLGGNRRTLRGYDNHLELLRGLGAYRKKALVHVVAALQTLRGMSEDMEELRERVAAPELVGSRIPVEVHMRSIRGGLERLKEGRVRARRLEEEAVRKVLGIAADE